MLIHFPFNSLKCSKNVAWIKTFLFVYFISFSLKLKLLLLCLEARTFLKIPQFLTVD